MITSDFPMQVFLTDNAVLSAANGTILPAYVTVSIDGHAKVLLAADNFIAANFTAPSILVW